MIKRLLFGSLGNNVADYFKFDFLVSKTVHLVNKRPVAFKECLRSDEAVDVPYPITPEMLTHGRELPSVNCIPKLQPDPEPEDWSDDPSKLVRDSYSKLRKVLEHLTVAYNKEFFATLVKQATDKKER